MKRLFILIFIITPLIYSCSRSEEKKNCKIDKITIYRLDKEMFEVDPYFIKDNTTKIINNCYLCLDIFSNDIIKIGHIEDSLYFVLLQSFISNYNNYQLYKRVIKLYDDISMIEEELTNAFCSIKSLLSNIEMPKVYAYVSGFNQKVYVKENTIGIGLENYLGRNEKLYDEYGFYNYLKTNMHRKKILPDIIYNYAKYLFPYNDSINNLITNIIYEGMIMYFVKRILPYYNDTLIFGFTSSELDFCKKNEKNMWTYLIENKLLFNNNPTIIGRFIKEGPYTQDFGRNSPAKAVVWIGYKIINNYAKKNNINLVNLMYERNYLKILNESKYNP